jgi:hypothetical protein
MNTARAAAAVAFLLCASAAHPATITKAGDTIALSGSIEQGDDERFAAALDDSIKIVSLTSDGGRVYESMAIGRTIRRHGFATEVPRGYACYSACALIWSAGRPRRVAGQLIFHCARDLDEQSCSEPGRQAMVRYLREMGASERLVTLQQAAGVSVGIWAKPEDLIEPTPLPRERPMIVADGRDYEEPQEWRDEAPRHAPEEQLRYPPPRRYAPAAPYPYGPPVAPGFIELPGGRVAPCALMIVGLPFCI